MSNPSFTQIIHSANPRELRSRRLYRLGRVTAVDGDLATVAVDKDDASQDLAIDSVQVAAPWSAQVGDWVDIAYLDDTPQSPFIRTILFSDTHDPATYMPRGRHDHLGDESRPFKTLCPSDPSQWMAQYIEGGAAYIVSSLPELHLRPVAQIRAMTILPVSDSAYDLGSGAGRWRAAYLSGQLSSSVTSGTAPFILASPTLVSNLNADMTDGQHLGTGDAPQFAHLGVSMGADASVPLSILRLDATQLQLLRAAGPSMGGSLLAHGPGGALWMAGNAYYDGTNWQRYNVAYPAWAVKLGPADDLLQISRASSGANPATLATLVTVNSDGQLGLPQTGSAGGLVLGGDANLYRSAANALKTDDALESLRLSLTSQSDAQVYRSTAQSIPHGTWTKVQLNAETRDVRNEFDSATNYRFTALEAGDYIVAGIAQFATNATGVRYISIYKNGALTRMMGLAAVSASVPITPSVSGIINLAANDYLELWVYQDSGGNLNISSQIYLDVHKVS
jgi:hypothetical protein